MVTGISLPFFANYPTGYAPAGPAGTLAAGSAVTGTAASSTAASSTAAGSLVDVLDIRAPQPGGSFTAVAGDAFSLSTLYDAGKTAFDTVARYRVALRDGSGDGRLTLNGTDVTGQLDFSPAEFNSLLFVAGANGSSHDLVVVARGGKGNGHGGLTGIVDSAPVEITAEVTGKRSINAVAALHTSIAGANDAKFLKVVQDAAVYGRFSSATKPALTTVGNFSAAAGDSFSLNALYDAGAKAFDTVARYRVSLRDPSGGGSLTINGVDVTGQVDFSPAEWNNLLFVAGPGGSAQDIVVVARAGKPNGRGGLTNIVDGAPVEITADITGTRSVNAAPALRTSIAGAADAGFLEIAQDAAIHSRFTSATQPALGTVGSFTAAAGDSFSMNEIYDAGPKAFDTVARYRVALRDPAGGGRLTLNGADVTNRVDFSPAEWNNLLFVAGPGGSSQELIVVARSGKPNGRGGLTSIVDSAAVQITAGVTGSRSINAVAALRTGVAGTGEAKFLKIAQDSSIYGRFSVASRPVLNTVGNLTAEAGDSFSLNELYDAGAKAFDTVARYRVALRDPAAGGSLTLNGIDVTAQVDFTPAEWNNLLFVAGPGSSAQDLVVVARAGKPDGHGGLTGIVDSGAVQITAKVTGARSINAATALRTSASGGPDADFLRVAQGASINGRFAGAKRPALSAVGGFTAAAGDTFSLNGLFDAGAKAFDTVARYRVALRDESGSGRLLLNGADVTHRVDFTPAEWNNLLFVAGAAGSRQDLVVVARGGKPDGHGGVTGIADSPAIQISASVTGERSVNAAGGLRTTGLGSEAKFLKVVQDAAIYGRFTGSKGPSLTTVVQGATPALALETLSGAVGAFQSTPPAAGAPGPDNLRSLYEGAIGSSLTTAAPASASNSLRALILLLDQSRVGALQVGGTPALTRQHFALQAYIKPTSR